MDPLSSGARFGPFLRQLRRRVGMTQADLAAAVGYSASFVSNLEIEARQPDLEMVARRFIPALALQEEPRLSERLIELAALTRGMRPPASLGSKQGNSRFWVEEGSGVIPGNIPAPPTPLVGRARDVDWICKRMLGHYGRLMTLTGPPGVGKTRLALEATSHLQAFYTDGACFIPLDAVDDPALVPLTIAAALGLEETGVHEPQQRLLAQLRRKEMLLALDNFEHILPAAPFLAELLAACPGLRILTTSRERLHLRSEQRYRVDPLPVEHAVELFLQAAAAVDPGLALAESAAPLLQELCLELDCLPLALELAAAQIEHLALPDLLARLRAQRLDVLSGGPADLPPRQQALRTAIDYSYDRLEPGEQALYRYLGAFAGGFDADAALSAGHERNALNTLVSKNLLQRMSEAEGTRFHMLDILRDFALEKLSLVGERAAARSRHARHYLALAERGERALYGPEQSRWFQRLGLEIHNARAAFQHFLLEAELLFAARLCVALRHFWTMQSRLEEGRMWLDRLLESGIGTLPLPLQVKVLNSRGSIAFYQGDLDAARHCFRQAMEQAESGGEPWGMAFALDGLGAEAASRGDVAAAAAYSQRSLALSQAHGYTWLSAITLINLGEIARQQGDDAVAASHYEESLALLRGIGDASFTAVTLINLAQIALNVGDPARAKTLARESLQLSAAGGQHHILAAGLEKLAAVATYEGRTSAAGRLFGAALALRHRYDIPIQPADRADYERARAAARSRRDAELFDEALAAGQTLSPDEALALI